MRNTAEPFPWHISVCSALERNLKGFDIDLPRDRLIVITGQSGICTYEDGRILLFNRAAEQSFGYGGPEVIGQDVDMLLQQRHRAQHVDQVRSFASEDGDIDRLMGHQREVWGLRKNGEEFPAEATVSRHSIDGRTILALDHRDIAERKELEEQPEAVANELDHRIRACFRWSVRSSHANVHNHFNQERQLVDYQTYKTRRSAALAEWQSLMA